ncbi:MAG: Pyruvate/proton symporter BtsT [Phycisphaerae bacterium]|nr:Pyruvate/proton symporter BtsT [Phycisphaerae bacterium]
MTLLLILLGSLTVLLIVGRYYSRFLARMIGENPERVTPANQFSDGLDFVPTPTPVVFAHHFSSIAGAGPIIGPLLAMCFGWLPAVLWIVLGGLFIGAVHDYCATFIAMREGGRSLAVVARKLLGKPAFLMLMFLIIAMLGLVTAVFLQISASALTNVATAAELGLISDQHVLNRHQFSTADGTSMVRIGGIASTSVIVITLLAPLIGWLYIKRQVNVWFCSLLALLICVASILVGLRWPVRADTDVWMIGISIYTLLAAGLPVWLFLQSRDFINVHMLYGGIALLVAALLGAGFNRVPMNFEMQSVARGSELTQGWWWPALFITIACGACSGFHSLCAGGTTCKQLRSETGARQVGYWAMLLESFLAICVVGAVSIGLTQSRYLQIVYPAGGDANVNLGFALSAGNAVQLGLGIPAVWGTIFGMLLLEGFVVTTLDTAIRLNRYLFEEIWNTLFARYDVFFQSAPTTTPQLTAASGTGGIPSTHAAIRYAADTLATTPLSTSGLRRGLLQLMRSPWFNTLLSVGLMIWMAYQGGVRTIWQLFASGNQLLAGLGLLIATIWLLQQGRKTIYTLLPAIFMMITTLTMLLKLLVQKYLPHAGTMSALLVTDLIMLSLSVLLLGQMIRVLWRGYSLRRSVAATEPLRA